MHAFKELERLLVATSDKTSTSFIQKTWDACTPFFIDCVIRVIRVAQAPRLIGGTCCQRTSFQHFSSIERTVC